jgi:hypothetical protein
LEKAQNLPNRSSLPAQFPAPNVPKLCPDAFPAPMRNSHAESGTIFMRTFQNSLAPVLHNFAINDFPAALIALRLFTLRISINFNVTGNLR